MRIIFIPEINVMIPPVQAGYSLEVVMIMMTEPEVTENERRMVSEIRWKYDRRESTSWVLLTDRSSDSRLDASVSM